jgi:hypothetical protein
MMAKKFKNIIQHKFKIKLILQYFICCTIAEFFTPSSSYFWCQKLVNDGIKTKLQLKFEIKSKLQFGFFTPLSNNS